MAAKGKVFIDLGLVNSNNIGTFKKINEVCLPTKYPNAFYDPTEAGTIYRLAYFNEIPVGAVKAALIFKNPQDKIPQSVSIQTIAVLEPYRHFGIGSKLLEYVEEETKKRFVHTIDLHVESNNQTLIEWYKAKGWGDAIEVKDYYKEHKLENPDAVYMSKTV